MCGLLAVHAPDGGVRPDRLARGLDRIAHRGPDARRVTVLGDGRVGLAHARLSMIGDGAGDQPLHSADGRLALVLNGELYDHERLGGELAARGHRLRTGSDSEILLHLYEERGTGCLARLRGEFAFVLWDAAAGRLFAARDRLGAKPLLHATTGTELLLASEAKALFAAGVPVRWDTEGFFQHSHVFLDQDRTLFDGVRQLPPGHFLLAEAGAVRTVRYWDLDFPPAGTGSGTGGAPDPDGAEAAEAVAAELDTAVRLRLRADVPVGCYLSDGVDSSAVLGLAARHAPGPVDAFTVVFDGESERSRDEGCAVAADTAARVGARLRPVPADGRLLAEHFADAVWHAESILPDTNTVAKYLLSRAARAAGCRAVLTGEGADELFGGYAFLRAGPARPGDPAGPGVPRAGAPALPTGRVAALLGSVPPFVVACAQGAVHQRALLDRGYLAGFAGRDPYDEFVERLDVAGQLAERHALHQSQYLLCKSLLPQYLLAQLGDRSELAHGIEGRLPFLDHPLVELVRTLPPRLLLDGAVEKQLLRDAVAPVLGPAVRARRKRVFWSPGGPRPGDPVHRMLQDVLRGPALGALPFYDRRAVLGLLDALPRLARVPAALAGASMQLLGAASACVLHERFGL